MKVISKLEKILENSLQEVQKAQKVQVDIERLKTENLKLRERCTTLLTRKRQDLGSDEAQELRQSLAQKDAEISQLQKLAAELKAQHAAPAAPAATAHAVRHATPVESGDDFRKPLANMAPVLPVAMQQQTQPLPSYQAPSQVVSAEEQEQLAHVEAKRFEWEQRCVAAEQRLQMLQQQLTESSKRYGSDISSLEVEIAKKDARIKELEFLMKQHE